MTARRALAAGGVAALLVSACAVAAAASGERFDHVVVTSPSPLPPVDVVAFDEAGVRRSTPVDAFASRAGGSELHLRARDLGARAATPPAGARWIVRARRDDGGAERVGYLVPRVADAVAPPPLGRLDAIAFVGARFSLAFPDGSGFYRDLRIGDAVKPLVHAIRLRVTATLPAGFAVTRSEEDFRWQVTGLDVGARFARRSSTASVRALLRDTEPRAQTALLADDLIEQRVRVDLPRSLLALARDVTLDNAFEVDAGTLALVPGASAWQPVRALAASSARYTWLVLASDAGALVHRLAPEGEAAALEPVLLSRARDGDGARWEVGYRVAHAERAAHAAGAAREGEVQRANPAAAADTADTTDDGRGFVLGQYVAILGDGAWAQALIADPERTRALARELEAELARPLPAWHATLEELSP
ncbi:MAG TPA: hypothetical protein VIS07_02975 [Candidatus Binatia bacterium]